MRRQGRPPSCTLHADADVCLQCPNGIPPCHGVEDRSLCASIVFGAKVQRQSGKFRGSLADLVSREQGLGTMPDGRPRVGFLSPVCFSAGGTEIWHETLLAHLDRQKVVVAGLAVIDAGGADPAMLARWRDRARAPVTLGAPALFDLAGRCDVLVSWGIARPGDFLPPRVKRPPLVAVCHGDPGSSWTVEVMASASPEADHFVAVARAAVAAIPHHRRAAATVIPNGIDPRRLRTTVPREAVRARWGVGPASKVLLQVCRLSPEKDPQAIARAVSALPPEWVGVAVGGGWHGQDVRDACERIAPGRVRFPGFTADVGSAYHAADCLIAASRTEGFGLSAFEGASAGLPVVSTPVGAVLDQPGAFELVTLDASGPELAAAVLRARPSRVDLSGYSAERFGAAWSDYLARIGSASRVA